MYLPTCPSVPMTVSLWLWICLVRCACRVKCDMELHQVTSITLSGSLAPSPFYSQACGIKWLMFLIGAAAKIFQIAHVTALRRIDESLMLLWISFSSWLPLNCSFLGWFSMNVYGEKNGSGSVGVFYTVLPVYLELKVAPAEGPLGNKGIKKIYTTP